MSFPLLVLMDTKKAFQVELKREREKKSNCHCTRGYIDMNVPCPDCFLGDLVANYMYAVEQLDKALYG